MTALRIRPITWAILAWMLIMFAAIGGAWKGSSSQLGAMPYITATTIGGSEKILPTEGQDLAGDMVSNPMPELTVRDDAHVSLRLSPPLTRVALLLLEIRDGEVYERLIPPGEESTIYVDARTDQGTLEGLVVQGVPLVYTEDGEESILEGEWALGVTVEEQPPTPASEHGIERDRQLGRPGDPAGTMDGERNLEDMPNPHVME